MRLRHSSPRRLTAMRAYTRSAQRRKTAARNDGTPRKVAGKSKAPRKGQEKRARNRRTHAFTAASPPNRTPPLPALDHLLYYQRMQRQKRLSGSAILIIWLFGGILAFSPLLAPPASADIYRWEDESGVIHFTDDRSTIPAKYRGKSREIQKTPPEAGKPSVSTMGAPSSPPGPSHSPRPSNGETIDRPSPPQDDDATAASMLRPKIDAKEQFIRAVDEKQSLATNPYRNRLVSPSDLELYRKYKEELPGDRERLKALDSRLAPVKEP
jgi:Domain of unknown function (DUF4124)